MFKAIKCPCKTSHKYTATRLTTIMKFRLLKLKDKYKNQTHYLQMYSEAKLSHGGTNRRNQIVVNG
jgi:hypothetical protein